MRHVVLLGDSTLDNGAYTGGSPDVLATLLPLLPSGWRATLLAVDGEGGQGGGQGPMAGQPFQSQRITSGKMAVPCLALCPPSPHA